MEAARVATQSDLERVEELAVQAHEELGPQRGGALLLRRELGRDHDVGTLAERLVDPSSRLVVGTIDGIVVGYGMVSVETLADGSKIGRITDLFVEPEARAVGIGEAIVGEVAGFCEREGCVGLDAFALPGSRVTKNFFETHGFTARLLVMHRATSETVVTDAHREP